MQLFSIDKKAIMAVTGLMLIGFVAMHLLGNLTVYFGPGGINAYAAVLERLGELLWVARAGLIAAVILHIVMAVLLTRENRSARPVDYAVKRSLHTTYAARTMAVSGVLLAVFVVYHLLHFTFRLTHPEISHFTDAAGRRDVYRMVVLSFQDPYLTGGYVAAMALLCSHLSHGIGSFLQSLGLNDERFLPAATNLGRFISAALFVGYASIPVSIYFGILKP